MRHFLLLFKAEEDKVLKMVLEWVKLKNPFSRLGSVSINF